MMPGQRQRSGLGKGCGCGGGGKGPAGVCICTACGHQVPHKPGSPCQEIACPQCGGTMSRGTG